jgi:hypothetical protein
MYRFHLLRLFSWNLSRRRALCLQLVLSHRWLSGSPPWLCLGAVPLTRGGSPLALKAETASPISNARHWRVCSPLDLLLRVPPLL